MIFLGDSDILDGIRKAKLTGLIDSPDTVIHFIDFEIIKNRIEIVREAFPASAIHTVAVKANPLTEVLKAVVREGFSLEAASYEEVVHANSCGSTHIGWDSPAKTKLEFEAIRNLHHVFINCDSLSEAQDCESYLNGHQVLLRINPQQSGSAHASMSVGGPYSKFGEPITNREQIIEFIKSHDFISGLHVHLSSQTTESSELVKAIRLIVDLANEINSSRKTQLKYINIGGGFPVDYSGEGNFDISDYARSIRLACPEFEAGKFVMITEFGRYYHANSGFTLTQISKVKRFDGHQVVIVHAGADMFLRECYQPGVWPHRYLHLDAECSNQISDVRINSDIAGPLCFGADYIQKGVEFAKANPGDWVVIKDTGANSVALWSKHCSRTFPKCILIQIGNPRIIRHRDSIEQNLAFWS